MTEADALQDMFGDPCDPDLILRNLTTISCARAKDEEEMHRPVS
jgi:hypothetical protein